jgi:CTP synthase (UTP-ammonia lyase)
MRMRTPLCSHSLTHFPFASCLLARMFGFPVCLPARPLARHARFPCLPCLVCLMLLQVAVIEFCRSVLNLENANSAEFDTDTSDPVVMYMPEISNLQVRDE